MSVVVLSKLDEIAALEPQWSDLASAACEPNPFYEPWFLIPAIRHLAPAKLQIVTVRGSGGELQGLFPIVPRNSYPALPLPAAALWRHVHCFLCTPLVARNREPEVLREFLEWADREVIGGVYFDYSNAGGEVALHLGRVTAAEGRRIDEIDSFERAALRSSLEPDEYLNSALKKKHRKDLERKLKTLGQCGTLEIQVPAPASEFDTLLQKFFELESSGWKGCQGTALRNRERERSFFTEMMREAHRRGEVVMQLLALDGLPIAMKCNLETGGEAFAVKIAYDERYAKYSPGVLLEIENLKYVLNNKALRSMDSCAAPNAEPFQRLWLERRRIGASLVSTQSALSRAMVGSVGWLRRSHRSRA